MGVFPPEVEEPRLNLDLSRKLIHIKTDVVSSFLFMPPARALLAAFWDLYPAFLWPPASVLSSIIHSVCFWIFMYQSTHYCILRS